MKAQRLVKLDEARAMWRRIAEDIGKALIAEAEKLVATIREDLRDWPHRAVEGSRS